MNAFSLVVSSIFLFLIVAFGNADAGAEDLSGQRATVNMGTVGIMSGALGGTDLRIAADLANAFDEAYDVRVLAIVGKGSVRDIEDLMLLRGIDIAIVQSDVLDFYRKNDLIPGIDDKIRYIAKLYNEEVHLLASTTVASVGDLQGRRVNFGPSDGGTYLTANIIFDELGLDVDVVTLPHQTALQRLRDGAIDAMVMVEGKPVDLFEKIGANELLHLLEIPSQDVRGAYVPIVLGADTYPNLVDAGETIEGIGVAEVLAAYNWAPGHEREVKLRRFVERFFAGFETLLDPAYHPKWQDVDLSADLPGWQRLQSADRLLTP